MNEKQVMRLCAAVTPEECEAVKYVLAQYFTFEEEDGCFHNPRADKELLSMAEHHERLSEAGRKGGLNSVQARLQAGLKRGNKRGASISTSTTTSISTDTTRTTIPPLTPPAGGDVRKLRRSSKSLKEYTQDFERFWDAYPERSGKGKAFESFERAIANGVGAETLAEKAAEYKAKIEWMRMQGRDINFCHASTWLNQRRWDDSYEIPKQDEYI